MKKTFAILTLSVLLLQPIGALAAPFTSIASSTCPAGATCIDPNLLSNGPSDIVKLINDITNWLFTILILGAVVLFIMAGYKYLTSGGGEEVASAHKMIAYGAVAVAVGFLAKGIVTVVEKLVAP